MPNQRQMFGYIRVSTVKQGEKGVSLQEQKEAIARYAARNEISVVNWFEERETAAKRGRPIFNGMLRLLRNGKAKGVILHKIDRGARNLRDWADLAELNDAGIEVHFANESLDLQSRGGRLSADIQAVVAADYIRNLREETLKGFYGRLKQGIYPLRAPVGYQDMGGGKPKEPDPKTAPLVRQAFEMYGANHYNLHDLRDELFRLGLRNHHGCKLSVNGLSVILHNPFYIGLIHLKKTDEIFEGAHTPLIEKSLFDRVQRVLSGKTNSRIHKHDFLFRRILRCEKCGYALIGEKQKGHNYYRCHTKDCPTTGVREDRVEQCIHKTLGLLCFDKEEIAYFKGELQKLEAGWSSKKEQDTKAMKLGLDQLHNRLHRLTDAFLDGTVDDQLFRERKSALLQEQTERQERLNKVVDQSQTSPQHCKKVLELAWNAQLSYKSCLPEEKRDLLKSITSNLHVSGKDIVVELSFPFSEVANRTKASCSGLQRDIPRIWDELLAHLLKLGEKGLLPDLSRAQFAIPTKSASRKTVRRGWFTYEKESGV